MLVRFTVRENSKPFFYIIYHNLFITIYLSQLAIISCNLCKVCSQLVLLLLRVTLYLERDAYSPGYKRKKELDAEKPQVALQMVRRSWKRCIRAAYFLADSWFAGIDFIKDLLEIAGGALHVICMTNFFVHILSQFW